MTKAKQKKSAPTITPEPASQPVVEQQAAEERKAKAIRPGDIKPVGQINNSWETILPGDTTRRELEDPNLWTFMGPRFQEMDSIRVSADDCSWTAFGIVHQVVANDVSVKFPEKWYMQLAPRSESELDIDGHLIRNCGRIRKYVIVKKGTGAIIKEGCASQMEAIVYLKDHLKSHSRRVA